MMLWASGSINVPDLKSYSALKIPKILPNGAAAVGSTAFQASAVFAIMERGPKGRATQMRTHTVGGMSSA
jgi:hypothetical protein